MDADLWAGIGGALAALAGGVWAAIRRRKKRAAGKTAAAAFRPRARFRAYLSLRTHDSDAPPLEIIPPEPPPVPAPRRPFFPELDADLPTREPPDDDDKPTNPPRSRGLK